MAIDGVKIIDSDEAHDIYHYVVDNYKDGKNIDKIIATILKDEKNYCINAFYTEIYWTALAYSLWKIDRLPEEIKNKTLAIIQNGADEFWHEIDDKAFSKRQKVLNKFALQLQNKNPKPTKVSKAKSKQTPFFNEGDVLAVKLKDEYGIVFVSAIDESPRKTEYHFACARLLQKHKPTMNDFLNRQMAYDEQDTCYWLKTDCWFTHEELELLLDNLEKIGEVELHEYRLSMYAPAYALEDIYREITRDIRLMQLELRDISSLVKSFKSYEKTEDDAQSPSEAHDRQHTLQTEQSADQSESDTQPGPLIAPETQEPQVQVQKADTPSPLAAPETPDTQEPPTQIQEADASSPLIAPETEKPSPPLIDERDEQIIHEDEKRKDLEQFACDWIQTNPYNFISKEAALNEFIIGMKIYEKPLFAFAAADDAMFQKLRSLEAIGPHFLLPEEWLSGAKTVISFFLPFTDPVVESNARNMQQPSPEWLHARYEGQTCLNQLMLSLKSKLESSGARAIVPTLAERFWSSTKETEVNGQMRPAFSSLWSERHIAFVCGLGTFGLSKNLITKRGACGRFGSLITDAVFTTDTRPYTQIYEYCTNCSLCADNCPAGAITVEEGKNHEKCLAFLMSVLEENRPRYGCGKCQVAVPCARQIPKPDPSE